MRTWLAGWRWREIPLQAMLTYWSCDKGPKVPICAEAEPTIVTWTCFLPAKATTLHASCSYCFCCHWKWSYWDSLCPEPKTQIQNLGGVEQMLDISQVADWSDRPTRSSFVLMASKTSPTSSLFPFPSRSKIIAKCQVCNLSQTTVD